MEDAGLPLIHTMEIDRIKIRIDVVFLNVYAM
jgi:hypothetical protein